MVNQSPFQKLFTDLSCLGSGRDCVPNGSPYHLFRLLLLYHDPELCAYLDTKKISPDSYAHQWFRSLFSAILNVKVTLSLWDVYFQLGDQFLVFFMSLILVFNLKEEIMNAGPEVDKSELISKRSLTWPACKTTAGLSQLVYQRKNTKRPADHRRRGPRGLERLVSALRYQDAAVLSKGNC